MSKLSRRTFVFGGVATAAVLAGAGRAGALAFLFTLGVASGEPLPDGVVLWTRLAPSPLNADGHGGMPNQDIPVDWEVATDAGFATIVTRGRVTARYAEAHSVHVEVGGLAPETEYHYRFRAEGHLSPAGRTRTRRPPTRWAATCSWRSPRAPTSNPVSTPSTGAWPRSARG